MSCHWRQAISKYPVFQQEDNNRHQTFALLSYSDISASMLNLAALDDVGGVAASCLVLSPAISSCRVINCCPILRSWHCSASLLNGSWSWAGLRCISDSCSSSLFPLLSCSRISRLCWMPPCRWACSWLLGSSCPWVRPSPPSCSPLPPSCGPRQWVSACRRRSQARRNSLSHSPQLYGRMSVWVNMCVLRLERWLKDLPHVGQRCGDSSRCRILWTARVRDWQNPLPHTSQTNGFSLAWMYLQNETEAATSEGCEHNKRHCSEQRGASPLWAIHSPRCIPANSPSEPSVSLWITLSPLCLCGGAVSSLSSLPHAPTQARNVPDTL